MCKEIMEVIVFASTRNKVIFISNKMALFKIAIFKYFNILNI